ncbi:MAG TPA: polysaccharide deacetylase family protein [Pyrinomonadaceae bacterium]|nr:polysaccharide deacetylase family protein [Pyrinomonadaceae bacterium]
MKRAVLNLMMRTNAFAPFRRANRGKALVLMYHRFSLEEDGAATSARTFNEQLEYLKSHYTIVPLAKIAEHVRDGANLPPGLAAITIDDGFDDAYEIAFPLLRQHGAPATLFVITDFLDRKAWMWTDKMRFLTSRTEVEEFELTIDGRQRRFELRGKWSRLDAATRLNEMLKKLPDEEKEEEIKRIASILGMKLPDLPPLEYSPVTWEQAREMDGAGIEIASHTLTHPILTNVSDERLRRELTGSRSRLEEELGHEVRSFCYPNGNLDERVLGATSAAGYDHAVATLPGLNDERSDPLALKRISAAADLAHFVQSTSGFEQMKNRLRGSRAEVLGEPVY